MKFITFFVLILLLLQLMIICANGNYGFGVGNRNRGGIIYKEFLFTNFTNEPSEHLLKFKYVAKEPISFIAFTTTNNILSEITFFKHHTICLTITDPFAFSLNGTVTVHGFSDYASLTSFEQNNVLLLPKKTYNEDTFEYEFCTTSMISFEDDREYLLPEEYLLQNSTAMPTETAITIESDATTILNNLNETCSGAMLEMSPNKTSKNIYCDKFVFAFFYFANLLLFKG